MLLLLFQGIEGQAGNLSQPFYRSARAMAQGNAPLSLSVDPGFGLFYNPAELGKYQKTEVEPLNFSVELNGDAIHGFSSTPQVTSLSGIRNDLQSNPSKVIHSGMALLPTLSTRGFAFGVLLQTQLTAEMADTDRIIYRSDYQLIPSFGYGRHFFGGRLKIGTSLSWVQRAVGVVNLLASSEPLGFNQNLYQGSSLSDSYGVGLTLPVQYLPTFEFVARNVFGGHYHSKSALSFTASSQGTPASDAEVIDTSFTLHPHLSRGVTLHTTVSLKDLTRKTEVFLTHLAIGVELEWRQKIFFQGGFREGYLSVGMGFKRPEADLSFALYQEELGQSYQDRRDLRVLFQYQFRV